METILPALALADPDAGNQFNVKLCFQRIRNSIPKRLFGGGDAGNQA